MLSGFLRTALLLPALLLGAACSEDVVPLGDGGSRDGGPESRDASGIGDGGPPRDAGAPDSGVDAGSAPVCASSSFDVQVIVEDPTERRFEGVVRVEETSPLRLVKTATPTKNSWTFTAVSSPWPADALRVGAEYRARIEIDAAFWTEARVAVYEIDGDATGRARLAFWTGQQAAEVSGFQIAYAPYACRVPDECGVRQGERLSVSEGDRDGIELEIDEQGVLGDLEVYNGPSETYFESPTCPETPLAWRAGWIARTSDVDCATLQRDACIASSSCILWGSETMDPGYLCLPAAFPCEGRSEEVCRGAVGCAWDPGACYCPEGLECACGGGPAPKCRIQCGGFTGGACPSERFCDYGAISAPECLPVPDDAGWCEYIPRTCIGTPNAPTCACSTDAQNYPNDCERRADVALGAVRGLCP